MKTTYNILILATTLCLSLNIAAQEDRIPLFNYEGRTLIHNSQAVEEEPLSEFELPITFVNDSIYPLASYEDDRRVFWLHGLGGTNITWINAAEASWRKRVQSFPPRKLLSITDIEYHETIDMTSAANKVHSNIISELTNLDDEVKHASFLIAHSQGGIVARTLYHQSFCEESYTELSKTPGGYVTFSSPHGGAQILNNTDFDDDYSKSSRFINNMAKKTGSPWVLAEYYEPKPLKVKFLEIIPITIDHKKFITYEQVETFTTNLQDIFMGGLKTTLKTSFVPDITEDYKVGAKHLLKLVDESCTIVDKDVHKIAFYGDEPQEHIFARTIQYMIRDPNSPKYKQHQGYKHFQANEDFELLHELNRMKNLFTEQYNKYLDKENNVRKKYEDKNCKIFEKYYSDGNYNCNRIYGDKWWEWTYGVGVTGLVVKLSDKKACNDCWEMYQDLNKIKDIKQKFKEGENWFNTVDREWRDLIGALERVAITSDKRCECEDLDKLGDVAQVTIESHEDCATEGVNKIKELIEDRNWDCWELEGTTMVRYSFIVKPNDGVVLAESQRALPYMTLKEDIDPIIDLKLKNTSHMQVRNNSA